MKRIITISLITIISLLVAPTAALASGKNSGEHKNYSYSQVEKHEDKNSKDEEYHSEKKTDEHKEDSKKSYVNHEEKKENDKKDEDKDSKEKHEYKDKDEKEHEDKKEDKKENNDCKDKPVVHPTPKPEPKPTPQPTPSPVVVVASNPTPAVLGATTLPNTGIVEDFGLPTLLIAGAIFIIAGVVLMGLSIVFKKTLSLKK